MIAVALAFGASVPAFADSVTVTTDRTGNTVTTVTPAAPATSAPVYNGTVTTVPSATVVVPANAEEEHGGLRNRLADQEERFREQQHDSLRAPTDTYVVTRSPEEEHGGLRNWLHDKKERAREKMGFNPDRD
jgi:hypothetical protein